MFISNYVSNSSKKTQKKHTQKKKHLEINLLTLDYFLAISNQVERHVLAANIKNRDEEKVYGLGSFSANKSACMRVVWGAAVVQRRTTTPKLESSLTPTF